MLTHKKNKRISIILFLQRMSKNIDLGPLEEKRKLLNYACLSLPVNIKRDACVSECKCAWMSKESLLYFVQCKCFHTYDYDVCKACVWVCVCVRVCALLHIVLQAFYCFLFLFHVWDVNHCKLKHHTAGPCGGGMDVIYSQSLVYKGHSHSYILLLLPDRWMLTQQCFSVQLMYMHEMRALSVYRSDSLLPI